MVNPDIFPTQKRGPSGPEAIGGVGPANFPPSCNILYFDPNYAISIENGSISNPYLTWANWVAGAVGTGSTKVIFPGVPVVAGVGAIPIDDGYSLVLEGIIGIDACSAVTGPSSVAACSDADVVFSARRLFFEALTLNAGPYASIFEHCNVQDLQGTTSGLLVGQRSNFETLEVPAADVTLVGGSVQTLDALNIDLTGVLVGSADGGSAGALSAESELIKCRDVTFVPGSTILFVDNAGELWLDPVSYRSFLDAGIVLTNGHVTRDDGSFPRDATTYNVASATPVVVDFYANPRATLNLSGEGSTDVDFTLPLTREVELTTVQGVSNGRLINWNVTTATLLWSDGDEPVQNTAAGSIAQYRFDYEEDTNTLIGYVVAVNALPAA